MNSIGADPCDWDKCCKLMADVDLGQFDGQDGREKFNMIGEFVWQDPNTTPFTGVFDGNGHTITNFTYTSTGIIYIGLFGYVDGYAEIKNLGLINTQVDVELVIVGSLVGLLRKGTISNTYVEGGYVSGGMSGGLVGYNEGGIITNCYSSGDVTASHSVGGLGVFNDGTITSCYSSGYISGHDGVGGLEVG